MARTYKRIIIAGIALFVIICFGVWYQGYGYLFIAKSEGRLRTITVGSKTFRAEEVTSQHDMARGLSGRRVLPAHTGMLFHFTEKQAATFWMKDMLIAIDILWIADGKLIGIERNVPMPRHNEEPQKRSASDLVSFVLEVPAHASDGLHAGDPVVIK